MVYLVQKFLSSYCNVTVCITLASVVLCLKYWIDVSKPGLGPVNSHDDDVTSKHSCNFLVSTKPCTIQNTSALFR